MKFSGESFGAECGCSDESSSSVAAADSTSVPASETAFLESASSSTVGSDSPAGGSGCDADSIFVTLPHLDELGGCFQRDADEEEGEEEEERGTSFFSRTSEHVGGVEAVYSAFFDEKEQDVSQGSRHDLFLVCVLLHELYELYEQ